MTWSLIHESGLDYAPTGPGQATETLAYPALVEPHADGTLLIVDELFFGKYVSITAECRTIRVDRSGRLMYDSHADGIHDGYGCVMDGGEMAMLQRTRWSLLLLAEGGGVKGAIDLTTISKGMPRLVTWTWRKTFLVAFVRGVGRIELAEIDRHGHLLWYLPCAAPPVGFAGSLQLLPNGHVLVSDEFHHVAVELARDGSWQWQFGTRGRAAPDAASLSNAKAVRQAPDGSRVVADTRNHRVMLLGADGGMTEVAPRGSSWSSPAFASRMQSGNLLVCDAGNRRVVELDPAGNVVWQYGQQVATRRWLSFPRSVEITAPGRYLIADTANNRVVEAAGGAVRACAGTDGAGLFWPRCVRQLPSGHYLIADGRNSRILELDATGRLHRELTSVSIAGDTALGDPHDVRLLKNGNLLVADASRDLVFEADWSGRVVWSVGGQGGVSLNDPHSAQRLPSGETLICDTGNDRVIRVDASGKVVHLLEAIRAPSQWFRLMRPRYSEAAGDGTLIIADADNNRVAASTLTGECRWVLGVIPHHRLPSLNQPRWVQAVSADELVVSDTLHHRILHLRRSGP